MVENHHKWSNMATSAVLQTIGWLAAFSLIGSDYWNCEIATHGHGMALRLLLCLRSIRTRLDVFTALSSRRTHRRRSPMRFNARGVSFVSLLVLCFVSFNGCNSLNPLCGSARPVPQIASISPSTVNFSDVEQGVTLTVTGTQFVASSQVVINSTALAATVVNAQQMKVELSTAVIPGPGLVKVMVMTPSGNSGDVGCKSGGNSSVLTLTVN